MTLRLLLLLLCKVKTERAHDMPRQTSHSSVAPTACWRVAVALFVAIVRASMVGGDRGTGAINFNSLLFFISQCLIHSFVPSTRYSVSGTPYSYSIRTYGVTIHIHRGAQRTAKPIDLCAFWSTCTDQHHQPPTVSLLLRRRAVGTYSETPQKQMPASGAIAIWCCWCWCRYAATGITTAATWHEVYFSYGHIVALLGLFPHFSRVIYLALSDRNTTGAVGSRPCLKHAAAWPSRGRAVIHLKELPSKLNCPSGDSTGLPTT